MKNTTEEGRRELGRQGSLRDKGDLKREHGRSRKTINLGMDPDGDESERSRMMGEPRKVVADRTGEAFEIKRTIALEDEEKL